MRSIKHILKTKLKAKESINDIAEIAAEFITQLPKININIDEMSPIRDRAAEISSGIHSIVIHSSRLESSMRMTLDITLQELQKEVFEGFGVIIPKVTISEGGIETQIQINDEFFPVYLNELEPSQLLLQLALELGKRLGELLTLETVRYYLKKLKPIYPDMINGISFFYSEEELTLHLRERLNRRISIKNLPRVFDELLSLENS